jgi:head-tail adaptor
MSEFAGILDQRVTLETAADVPDGGGGYTRTWVPIATSWANVRVTPAELAEQSGRLKQVDSADVLMRRRLLPPKIRLKWRWQVWRVVSVDHPVDAPDRMRLTVQAEARA